MTIQPGKDTPRPAVPPTAVTPDDRRQHEPPQHTSSHRGHGLMMLACCAPMLVIAFVLVATGAVGAGAVLYALLCIAMMAAMVFVMPGHRH